MARLGVGDFGWRFEKGRNVVAAIDSAVAVVIAVKRVVAMYNVNTNCVWNTAIKMINDEGMLKRTKR